jgi:hypothetical protein
MHPLVLANPFLVTLITYLFSLLLFACLASLCACLHLAYPSHHHYPSKYVGLPSKYVIKSFILFYSTVAPIIAFLSFQSFFTKVLFSTFAPWVLSPTFHFYHFHDFLQPACFSACLLLLCVASALRNCLCQFVSVSWTEGVLCSVCYSS